MGRQQLSDDDYYIENGKWVFTEHYLRRRGWCCNNDCRHCPYKAKPMQITPGPYIWKAKDADYPVTVVAYLGKGPDGREYVSIAGSNTAVPADELQKEKRVQSESRKPKTSRLF